MPLEAEVSGMVLTGYIIVCTFVVVALSILWSRTKNSGLLWFIPHLIFLSMSFYAFYSLINNREDITSVMRSATNSLSVGTMGVFWGLSVIFMIIGIADSVGRTSK